MCHHLDIRGFLDGGYTDNPNCPLNRFNGPVGYDDRANELVDQLYLTAERVTKVENDCGIDYGYRADLMYGTDPASCRRSRAASGTAAGTTATASTAWPCRSCTAHLQYNKLTLHGGHFYAPCGYEVAMPTSNFFYSHTYGFLYGMPTTLTGGYGDLQAPGQAPGQRRLGYRLERVRSPERQGQRHVRLSTGPAKDDKINVTSECVHRQHPARRHRQHPRRVRHGHHGQVGRQVALYLREHRRPRFRHIARSATGTLPARPASWTGLSNYLLYDINDCWGLGLRYEYFEDLDGAVVTQVGPRGDADPHEPGFQVERRDGRPELEAQQERHHAERSSLGLGLELGRRMAQALRRRQQQQPVPVGQRHHRPLLSGENRIAADRVGGGSPNELWGEWKSAVLKG